MQFNSAQFLIFFPVVVIVYALIPKKTRYIWLLLASYFFYACWNVKYTLLLLFSTAATYAGSLLLTKALDEGRKTRAKAVIGVTIGINLAILAYFKYANFFIESLSKGLNLAGVNASFSLVNVLLPVGISFYIFQAIGYTIDVYRRELPPEKNFLRYALFVSFFPQLVAGPIERSENLMPQLNNLDKVRIWDYKRIERGLLVMLYGFFLKVVISDRISAPIDNIFNNVSVYSPREFLTAMVLFSVQIYCDFAGYTYIAIGAAKVMGVNLMNNFSSPYLSTSIKEFWNRWHISLSSWFKDYLYFPLGGGRRGRARKCLNLFIVFLVSGLWHGAAWHFVIWGLIHAVFRVAGELTEPYRAALRKKAGISEKNPVLFTLRLLLTFALVTYAWLFFRASSVGDALFITKSFFTSPWTTAAVPLATVLGWSSKEVVLVVVIMAMLVISDILRYLGVDVTAAYEKMPPVARILIFVLAIAFILMFGVYGPDSGAAGFIYFQF